jgi:hypothetical protein
VPERISASIILHNPSSCPTNKVTLGIYTDACYPQGVGTLLASAEATVPSSPCGLAVAKLRNAPALTAGTKYWIAATTNAEQDGLDAEWYPTTAGQVATNVGDGWVQGFGVPPGFMVEGSGTVLVDLTPARRRPFASNLIVDPCSGCNHDAYFGGYYLRGPQGCGVNETSWIGISFVASSSGVPNRLLASINLNNSEFCTEDKVTLSLYTDSCGLGPGTALVSGQAKIPTAECGLAAAKLRNAPQLTKGTKYWVVASTSTAQATLNATWFLTNTNQACFDIGTGWFQSSFGTATFAVE